MNTTPTNPADQTSRPNQANQAVPAGVPSDTASLGPGDVYPYSWEWPGVRVGWLAGQTVYAGAQNATVVLGPPRSGKTTLLIAPAVALAPGPVVATSTKPDLADLTVPWRQARGTCWYFDPSATTAVPEGLRQLRWSPLHNCADWPTAITRAHALASAANDPYGDNAHWAERAETLLAALLHAAALKKTTMTWVLQAVLGRDIDQAVGVLASAPGDPLAGYSLQGVAETDERERSGIFSTAARLLSAYRNTKALQLAADTNFDPARFAHSADTVYLVAPSAAQAQLAPIVISLLEQIRSDTYQRHPSWPPTLFALDETANIAPLPDLPAILAEGAGQGLVTLTSLQDLNQARARWGRQADGFLTLHAVKVALGGIADPPTLQALSYLAGNRDVTYKTHSGYQQGLVERVTWTQTVAQRPRIPPETINTLPRHQAYLAHSTHPPTIIDLHPPAPPARTGRPGRAGWAGRAANTVKALTASRQNKGPAK